MKVLFLIILNSVLLFLGIKYFNVYLFPAGNIDPLSTSCINEVKAFCDIKSYLMLGTFISLGNLLVVFIFKTMNLPDYFVTKLVGILVSTTLVFVFFSKILELLKISMLSYNISGITNFIIIVAIFGFLNTLYSIIFIK